MKNRLIVICLFFTSQLFAENVLLLTLPKTGTNLVLKLLRIVLNEKMNPNVHSITRAIYWGHTWKLHSEIGELNPNLEKVETLINLNFKLILVLRDPRQHVISLLRATNKPIDTASIEYGIRNFTHLLAQQTGSNAFLQYSDINECYKKYLLWEKEYPQVYVTSFEKLVGPEGGGSATAQYKEVMRLSKFVGIEMNNIEAQKIATLLFGDTPTFIEGQIDSWKKYYSSDNKTLFKNIAGKLLIELGYEKDYDW